MTPMLNSVLICRRTVLSCLVATGLVLGPEEIRFDVSNVSRVSAGCNNSRKNLEEAARTSGKPLCWNGLRRSA
jgi:hypothetical protein